MAVTTVASTDAVPGVPPPGTTARGYDRGFWGVAMLIATEAVIFLALISSYFFVWASSRTWPQGGIEPPELTKIVIFTPVLLASSIPVFWAEAAIRRNRVGQLRIGLFIAFVMGLAFLVNQVVEYRELTFGWRDNAYASLFYVITGLHGLHVLVGLLISLVVQAKAALHRFDAHHHTSVQVFSLYWHFVDAVWIVVFSSLYLAPHLRS
jgi:heme/copper-type cytochrome/quinol oxidase subunit 3